MDENEKQQKGYSQEKMKRIAVGATVAGVLLLVFLLIVLIVQFVQIGVRRAELKSLEKKIAQYEEWIEKDQKVLDDYLEGDALYYEALKRGWHK